MLETEKINLKLTEQPPDERLKRLQDWWREGAGIGKITGQPAGVVPIEELGPVMPEAITEKP